MISGKREKLAALLNRTGCANVMFQLRQRLPLQFLTILTYHRVSHQAGQEPFDPDLIDATPEQFDSQLEVIARHFNVISCSDLRGHLMEGAELPPNPCLITFDDGYKDCLNIALPLLKKHGLTGVFFIATDFVSHRRAYWWDRIHYLVAYGSHSQIRLTYPLTVDLDFQKDRRNSTLKLLRIVKNERGLNLSRFLDAIAEALAVEWNQEIERDIADSMVMTWDEVRALRQAGMDIQSHTCSHRVLQNLDDAELAHELTESRRVLENQLGQSIYAVAFPVGKSIASEPRILAAVQKAGYEIGFSNVGGFHRLALNKNPYDISRFGMNRSFSLQLFKMMMALPWLQYR